MDKFIEGRFYKYSGEEPVFVEFKGWGYDYVMRVKTLIFEVINGELSGKRVRRPLHDIEKQIGRFAEVSEELVSPSDRRN